MKLKFYVNSTLFFILSFFLLFPLSGASGFELSRLRVGITAVTIQEEINLNQRLFELISEKLGMPVEIVYRSSYKKISLLLKNGSVDIGYVCGLPYVLDHDEFGLELLAAPLVKGKPLYQSYIIVPKNSPVKSLEELRGKTFAFSDPLSNSGMLVPYSKLSLIGETPETFFKKYFFSYGHTNSIEAVALNLADGASVDSYVYNLAIKTNPDVTSKTRIIDKSDFMPITPLVMRPTLPKDIKLKLKEVILNLHSSEEGRNVLQSLEIDRFTEIKDSDYNSIRKMFRSVFGDGKLVKR